jgi:predicted secreted protein
VNKQGSEVLCRVESLSIRDALGIPKSFSIVSKPFHEEKLISVYRECPSEVSDLFLQTIVKP